MSKYANYIQHQKDKVLFVCNLSIILEFYVKKKVTLVRRSF